LLIFHRKLGRTGVFRIEAGNPVMPFCFLEFWGLVKHIHTSSIRSPAAGEAGEGGDRGAGGPEEIA